MTERTLTPPPRTRRALRRALVTAVTAALAVTALPFTASSAVAAEASSALTVDIPTSWIPTEGGTLTVSKTTGLVDGETITVSGVIPVRATSAAGFWGGALQTATSYAPEVVTKLTDTPVSRGTKTALTPAPNGWSIASTVEATVTVQSSFTTGANGGLSDASPEGIAVDCKVEQCFLALTSGVWNNGESGGSNNPDAPAIWIPITFEGGNAELARDVLPAVTGQPADATVAPGETAIFRTTVTAQPTPTYRWQTSADDGATWADIAGATSAELSVTASETDDGRLYRAVVSNRQGTATTRTAALSVTVPVTEPGADNGRWPLRQPGSWVRLSSFSELVDGQQLTVEANYLGVAAVGADFPAKRELPVIQAGWNVSGHNANLHSEASAQWLPADAVGNDRYEGSTTYTVHSTLTDEITGEVTDCLVTQCYLAVGGQGLNSDLTAFGYAYWGFTPGYVEGQGYAEGLRYLRAADSVLSDNSNTVFIPLYFEGGTLTPQLRQAPTVTTAPASQTVDENTTATFTVGTAAVPAASVTWQRSTDGGRTWRTIGGATGSTYSAFATAALNHAQYRAVATNGLGTTISDPATLTVNAAGDTGGSGVTLEWTGNAELQGLAPNRQPNYFSAGSSDGTKATYVNVDGDAKIVWRKSDGSEVLKTYDTRSTHIAQGGQQLVRLSNGTADLDAAGAGTISWTGSWTVNFYGGLVPFTFTDPHLTIAEDGTGTLVADLSGYGSSMDDPGTKVPLDPTEDVVVSTFSSVTLRDGVLSIVPDYAGVEFEIPADSGAYEQDRTVNGWGAWPQSFVDFHFTTGLTSYWYTSGGSADSLKPGLPFTVSGITLPEATVPAAPAAPTVAAVSGTELDVTWGAPATGGSPITGYIVSLLGPDGVTTVDAAADATSVTFADLAAGSYSASVIANNAIGSSEASESSAVVTIVGATPDGESKPEGAPTLADDTLFDEPSATELSVTVADGVATITLPDREGEWAGVSFHSDPVWLGWHQVTDGVIRVELPEGAEGAHHLVVYAADGSVIGYAAIDLGSDSGAGTGTDSGAGTDTGAGSSDSATADALATTGGQLSLAAVVLASLLLLGGGVILTGRARARAR